MSLNYDVVQHSCGSYAASTPSRMYTIAKFFGCQAKDYKQARILELACGQGHQLIALAVQYPQATFIGLDATAQHIQIGKKIIADLKLTNIQLECAPLLEVDPKLGQFDYMVMHGFFSLATDVMRQKIFTIMQQRLTPEGLAYISYNVLPGWNFNKTIRDLLLFNTRKINSRQQKTTQAKQILRVIADKLKDQKHYYADFMQTAAKNLITFTDERLLLEYLEKINRPIYVYDFVRQAMKHDLVYLSDTVIYNNHFRDVIPFSKDELDKVLQIDSYLELMQQSDFLLNRQFRRTILCKKQQPINRKVAAGVFENIYLHPLSEISVNVDKGVNDSVLADKNHELFVKLIEILNKQKGGDIHYTALFKLIDIEKYKKPHKKIKPKNAKVTKASIDSQQLKDMFDKLLLKLYHDGYIDISFEPQSYILALNLKPKVSPLTRYYAAHFNFVINHQQDIVPLDNMAKLMLQMLDGTKTIDEIAAALLIAVKSNTKLFPTEIINEKNVQKYCREILVKWSNAAILIA